LTHAHKLASKSEFAKTNSDRKDPAFLQPILSPEDNFPLPARFIMGNKKPGLSARGWPKDPGNFD
jgi:hypothetical protein